MRSAISAKSKKSSENSRVQMVGGRRGKEETTEQKGTESLPGEAGQRCKPHDWVYGLVVLLTGGLKISVQHLCGRENKTCRSLFSTAPKSFSSGPQLVSYLFSRVKALWLPGSTPPGRQSSHLPSVVIHSYPCQSSPSPSGFIKLFLPNTYSAVSEWSPSKHSLLHFTTFLHTAGVVAIWPSP